jgi:hypothetical protein
MASCVRLLIGLMSYAYRHLAQIYHDSCHSEMMRSRLLAATSRGTATTASSREGTPLSADARGVTPPSGSTMRKRKADEADDAATEDEAVKRVKAEEE